MATIRCNVAYEVRNNTEDKSELSTGVLACKYMPLNHTLLSDWSQLFGTNERTTWFETADSVLAGGLVAKSAIRP